MIKILFNIICLFFLSAQIFALNPKDNTANNFITLMPDVTYEMTFAKFWIDMMEEPDLVILTSSQIEAMNKKAFENLIWLDTLRDWDQEILRYELLEKIDTAFPDRELYINDSLITSDYIKNVIKNMNLDNIAESKTVEYGIIVNKTNTKAFPVNDIITGEQNDIAFNILQVSALFTGEPVLILHESLDNQFYFCASKYFYAWIDKNDIALCDSKNEWLEAQTFNNFLLVTGNSIKLDENPFYPGLSGLEFYMGTKLNLVPVSEQPESLHGRIVYGNYVVKIPVRDSGGFLDYAYVPVPVSKDVSIGYMPYTYRNVFNQLFKMQGDRYGWGGMLNARDCSALTQELYRCFGIYLPRNSRWQSGYTGRRINLPQLSIEEKDKIISEQVPPGALMQFPGHIMVYLGFYNGKFYVMSSVDSFFMFEEESNGIQMQTRSVIINTLDIKRRSGLTWMESLAAIMIIDEI